MGRWMPGLLALCPLAAGISAPADEPAQAPRADGDPALIGVIVQPLVGWLWVGGGIMALGTLLAAVPGRRRRRPVEPVSAPADHQPEPDMRTEPQLAGA